MRRERDGSRAPLLGDHQPVSGKTGSGVSSGSHLETGVPPAAEKSPLIFLKKGIDFLERKK